MVVATIRGQSVLKYVTTIYYGGMKTASKTYLWNISPWQNPSTGPKVHPDWYFKGKNGRKISKLTSTQATLFYTKRQIPCLPNVSRGACTKIFPGFMEKLPPVSSLFACTWYLYLLKKSRNIQNYTESPINNSTL